MIRRSLLSLLLSILLSVVFAGTPDNPAFKNFAAKQDSLMYKSYNDRNVQAYLTYLQEYESHYKALSGDDKKLYRNGYSIDLYNLSCLYSILNKRDEAIEYLKKSVDAGYANYKGIQKDKDMDNIRDLGKFKTILESMRDIADYVYILKKAGTYNLEEKRDLPGFIYQPLTNQNLIILRKEFNLDSISGKGNEVSKILNLMHWVHNLIPHDGSNANPTVRNAMNMITVCRKEKRGLNCRGLATVLNECYLAMGLKSRFITCLPKDSLGIDTDCHVINMVYSNELKKWLWIDPTFDAYVMNDKGQLLSIEEVRDGIINDKPLILNPEANWNHTTSQTKENYLYSYMAKNLYILECPIISEYDTETYIPGKQIGYIRLVPLDYFKKSLETSIESNKKDNTTYSFYKTNNPSWFLQVPK